MQVARSAAGRARVGLHRAALAVLPYAKPLYSRLPLRLRLALRDGLIRLGGPTPPASSTQAFLAALAATARPGRAAEGVALVGYPFGEFGLGESTRSMALGLASTGIALDVVDIGSLTRHRQDDRTIASLVTNRMGRRVNILHVNCDALPDTMAALGRVHFEGRYTIVRPYWELDRIDPAWIAALSKVDEIWAPTRFVADVFRQAVDMPVTHVPVSIEIEAQPDGLRARLGLPEARHLFLFAFDFHSFPARKNPEAAVAAFERAFAGDRDAPVGLVVKVMGDNQRRAEAMGRLRDAAARDPRIHVVDAMLSRADQLALIAACDSFVSLHRSEGFGYGPAEAMCLGKPVIATDFSGTTDFVSERTGYPVGYRLVPVAADEYPYVQPGSVWADPDIDAAAAHMRAIVGDPAGAARRGQAARAHMAANHGHAAVGRLMAARLQQIEAAGSGGRRARETT